MIADLKPYPEYKESGLPWLGPVPAHWVLAPNRGLVRKRKVLVGKRHSDYRLLSLTKQGVIVRDISAGKGKFSSDMGTSQEVRSGDLVFCLFDVPETPRTVGLSRHRGMITGAYTVFEFLGVGSCEYFELFYRAMDDRKLLSPLYSGLRNTIPAERFLCTKTPQPPLTEQAAIVRFLDWANGRLERATRAKLKVTALLNELKQAIIHRAVTRGLDPSVPFKPSSIPCLGDIPQHWRVLPLKAVCKIQSGVTLGKDYTGQTLSEYPYLRVANVQAGHANLAVVKSIRVTEAEALRCSLQQGDVLMTEGGDPDKLGRGCVWDAQVTPCLHQNHIFAVRPNQSDLVPHFLSALMGTGYARAYFQSTAKQTTNLAATNKTTIGQFKVLLPKVDEQNRILAALHDGTRPANTAISSLGGEIELLREYRTRLVVDVVTGKLDVREAAAQLPEEAAAETAEDDTDLGIVPEAADEEVAV
jgi:type I restriction enzyme, S subunit